MTKNTASNPIDPGVGIGHVYLKVADLGPLMFTHSLDLTALLKEA